MVVLFFTRLSFSQVVHSLATSLQADRSTVHIFFCRDASPNWSTLAIVSFVRFVLERFTPTVYRLLPPRQCIYAVTQFPRM